MNGDNDVQTSDIPLESPPEQSEQPPSSQPQDTPTIKQDDQKQEFSTLDLEQAVRSIMGEVDEAALEPAVNLLIKIIKNILSSKDPKFRSLNLAKPIFQEKIGRFASCVRFLTVLGFKHEKETKSSRLEEENAKRLEHACLLLQEALFTLEKEAKSQEVEDFRATEPDYDLSQVRIILQQLGKQIEECVKAEQGQNYVEEQYEQKLFATLNSLLRINSNLVTPPPTPPSATVIASTTTTTPSSTTTTTVTTTTPSTATNDTTAPDNSPPSYTIPSPKEDYRNVDVENEEFFVRGWSKALEYLQFLGFEQKEARFTLQHEHKTKISRACSVLKRYIEEVTPTEVQLRHRQAQRKPPERHVQFFSANAVKNPQLEGDYDRSDANLLLQAASSHQKRLKEQFPDVIVTRQRRAEEKAKAKRIYDRTLVRVLFNDINPENQIILQAYFSPYETIEALFALVQAHLGTPSKPFYFLNPPEAIEPPSTVIFDRDSPSSPSATSGQGGQARHLGSRLLGPPKKKEKKPSTTFHMAEKKAIPSFAELRLVPAAALHFHWSDGSVVCNALLGECYVHKRPLEVPNIPKAINYATEVSKPEEGKKSAQPKDPKEEREKKRRLKEAAMMRKMGFDE